MTCSNCHHPVDRQPHAWWRYHVLCLACLYSLAYAFVYLRHRGGEN